MLYHFISDRIKEARTERGMSRHGLARFVYKTGKAISDLESGRVHVDLFDISLIASALDKPVSCFFPRLSRKEMRKTSVPMKGS
jgi:transcriptional regulator with XRE-family HTH domain